MLIIKRPNWDYPSDMAEAEPDSVSVPASRCQPKGSTFMTRSMLRGVLGGLLALIALANPARAVDETKPSQPYVVVVGISKYQDAQIQVRPRAEDDAKA